MTTLAILSKSLDLSSKEPLGSRILSYFRARFRSRVHKAIVAAFVEAQEKHDLAKADVARKMDRGAEQVTRWLGAPTNLTLDTVSDLLVAIGKEADFVIRDIELSSKRNYVPAVIIKAQAIQADEAKKQTGTIKVTTLRLGKVAASTASNAEPLKIELR